MANTLTGLVPTIYTALDVVSREQIGFIPNVNRDATAAAGAVGQTVRSPIVPAAALEDITPGADPANSGDQTIGYADVSISKSKAYPIRWTGEEQLSVSQLVSITRSWLISLRRVSELSQMPLRLILQPRPK